MMKSTYISPRFPFSLLLITCLLLLGACGRQSGTQPKAVRGTLDLSGWDFHRDGPVSLQGKWEFRWKRFIQPGIADSAPRYLKVPRNWIGFKSHEGETAAGFGFGSYRLKIRLPTGKQAEYLGLRLPVIGTSYRVLVNGRKLTGKGKIGTTSAAASPRYGRKIAFFPLRSGVRELEIIIHVANFSHRSGGLWFNIELGRPDQLHKSRDLSLFLDFFLFGALLIMGLYHVGLFLNRAQDKASLLFGLFSLIFAVRILFTGQYFIYDILPNMPWNLGIRIEYMTHILGTPLFTAFVAVLFADKSKKPAIIIACVVCGLFAAHAILFSPAAFSAALIYFELVLAVVGGYLLFMTSRAVFHGREGSIAALIGGLAFSASVVNDILHAASIIQTAFLAPLGLFLFFFAQSYMLARIFSGAFRSVVNLTQNLTQLNSAYSRFVPLEFLKLLGKSDVREIRLGDQVAREMTILFADIRSFTSLSESMTPAENFNFLNSYLKRMGPIVQSHNGYIDKYIGDSIMALFPGSADDALDAALAMQSELERYNEYRSGRSFQTIQVGMGIHTGRLMLGTIGDATRMDGTVISDAVNLASRLEELTKFYQAGILFSENTLNALKSSEQYSTRMLDRVQVRGKSEYVVVHQLLMKTDQGAVSRASDFETAVVAYLSGDYETCRDLMNQVLEQDPEDGTAALYIVRCDAAEQRARQGA